MKIQPITEETYEQLRDIQEQHPELTLQNEGYEYLDKREFSPETMDAYQTVSDILREHIDGFRKFHNFKLSRNGEVRLRFDYKWDSSFTGAGYLLLDELLNGFRKEIGK